ncbi:hypothetical protein Hanom_Chr02g00151721 [Helianthus anomalus]
MILFSIMFLDPTRPDPTRTTTDPKNLNTRKIRPYCPKILGPPLGVWDSFSKQLINLSHKLQVRISNFSKTTFLNTKTTSIS